MQGKRKQRITRGDQLEDEEMNTFPLLITEQMTLFMIKTCILCTL